MGVLAAVGAAFGASTYVVTPLVSMVRRGTVDEQAVASWRAEGQQVAAVTRARRRAALVASIPAPRGPVHDQRRSPLAG